MLTIRKPVIARLEPQKGNLRIVVTIDKKRHVISTGLKDDPVNRQLATNIVNQIKLDDQLNQLDQTLNKYKPKHTGRGGSLLLVSKLLKDFIEYKKPTLERNSLTRYQNLSNYVTKFLAGVYVTDLTPEIAQEFRDKLLKKLSNNTVKDYLMVLNSCLNWGVERELLSSNPFLKASRGIKSNEIEESEIFELDEVKLIFLKADLLIPAYSAYIKFLFLTGCRPGEGVALKWEDVNFSKRKLTIDESYDGVDFKPTKTRKSRTFNMDDKVYSLLKSLSKECALVFHKDNQPIVYQTFKKNWDSFLNKLGIPDRSPYSCRHTFITFACRKAGEGGIAEIAYQVGNSKETILNHYFHRNENKVISFDF